ncbi:MAG: hypothetical protein KAQ83_02845, partial [Nanoarchaeota archaeon]|nr:hypothetical protein [Nanoarchaeota archaeon]
KKIANIWASAGLPERQSQPDIVSERLSGLERHIANSDENISVTMGTTPSGIPSLANLYTFVNGVKTVKEVADSQGKRTNFLFGINNHLVYDDVVEIQERIDAIKDVLSEIDEKLGVKIARSYFSKMQRTAPFRFLLQRAADQNMFACSKDDGLTLSERTKWGVGYVHLHGHEANERKDYVKSNSDFISDLATSVLLRNAVANSDVHILGGDVSHAINLANKAKQLSVAPPLVYITGIMYGPDGEEMHAGGRNTFKLVDLKSPSTWIEDLAALKPRPSGDIGVLEYQKLLTPKAAERIYQPHKPELDDFRILLGGDLSGQSMMRVERYRR